MEHNEEPTNTKIVFEKLVEEGFRPVLENDYSIKFKYEGSTFWIDLNEDDDELYEVISAFIWQIESPEELANAYIAASEASRTIKVAKVWVTANKENVWVKSSMLHEDANGFANVLIRALNTTRSAKNKFIEKIKKLEGDRLDALEAPSIGYQDHPTITLHAKKGDGETWSTEATYDRVLGTLSDISDNRFLRIKQDDGFSFTAIVDGFESEVTVEYNDDENNFTVDDMPF